MVVAKNQLKNLPNLKTELAYSKVEHLLSIYYEDQLRKEVSQVFHEMKLEILKNLEEYYTDVMFQAHLDLILSPIQELHKLYYETLLKYKIREFDKSREAGKRIVERTINFRRKGNIITNQFTLKSDINSVASSIISKDKLFGTSEIAHENLASRTYQLSERTLARVDNNINDIITKGYDGGWGAKSVAHDINKRFNQLETWEAKRIARTEIHNSHCLGLIQGYDDMGVEYIEWSAANDSRVRDSHIHLDGEIIPMGGVFSNGLRYPGDMLGVAKEVINCRCQALPFIMPYGYIAPPGMAQFREEDLITTLDYFNADDIISHAIIETDIPQNIVTAGFEEKILAFEQLSQKEQLKQLGKALDPSQRSVYQKVIVNERNLLKQLETATDATEIKKLKHDLSETQELKRKFHELVFRPRTTVPEYDVEEYIMHPNMKTVHIPDYELEMIEITAQNNVNFKKEELESLFYYGSQNHWKINGKLESNPKYLEYIRGLSPSKLKKELKWIDETIDSLDSAMSRTNGLTQKTRLYSARGWDPTLREGDIGTWDRFASTSFQKKSAEGFYYDTDRYLVTILADEGQQGVVMNGIKAGFKHEHEFLLPRGQKFQLLKVDHKNKKAIVKLVNNIKKPTEIPQTVKIRGFNKYALSDEEYSILNDYRSGKTKGFLKKVKAKRLDSKMKLDNLHKSYVNGDLPKEMEDSYFRLKKAYDYVELKETGIDHIGFSKNKDAFKLTNDQLQLIQNKKYLDLNYVEEQYIDSLERREILDEYHKKLVTSPNGLINPRDVNTYIDFYEQVRRTDPNLPYLPLDTKLSWYTGKRMPVTSCEFKLNDEEQKIYKQLLHKEVYKHPLTDNEYDKLIKLKYKNNFAGKYSKIEYEISKYKREGYTPSSYDLSNLLKYYYLSENKLRITEKELLEKFIPSIKKVNSNIKYSEITKDTKLIKLKGATYDGNLPNGDDILNWFTCDSKKLGVRELDVMSEWSGNVYTKIRDFTTRCNCDINKYVSYLMKDKGIEEITNIKLSRNDYYNCIMGKALCKAEAKVIDRMVKDMDMLTAHQNLKPMVTWRVERRHHLGDNPQVGDIVIFEGFNSVAITKEGMKNYTDIASANDFKWIYEIETPIGTNGIYIGPISEFSEEMEFLLARNTKMEILEFVEDGRFGYAKLRIRPDLS